MRTCDLPNGYRMTISEMSRRSQLVISSWFNEWLLSTQGEVIPKFKTVSAISTQVILHSRVALYRGDERLSDGLHKIEDGLTITLPLTEAGLDDLPASVAAWMIDAAGQENASTLANFLAGIRAATTNGKTTFARLSANGLLNKPM